jgi:hypothetical protein
MTVDAFGDITPTMGIVTLKELKAHLRYPQPAQPNTDDDQLEGFIYAATEVVENQVGKVVQRRVTEYHDGGQQAIYLRQKPVVSVVNITENWGYFNWILVEQPSTTVPATNLFAYSLDNPSQGRVTRRTVGNVSIPFMAMGSMFPNNILAEYIAGRVVIPWAIKLATLELCAHWWQNSQQRDYATGGLNSTYDNIVQDTGSTGYNAGVPYRILEILKAHRRTPIIG